MGVNDSLGHLGVHLTQVRRSYVQYFHCYMYIIETSMSNMLMLILQIAAYSKHIANIASTAISSRQLLISLEAKLTEKEKLILTLEDSVKAKDDQI